MPLLKVYLKDSILDPLNLKKKKKCSGTIQVKSCTNQIQNVYKQILYFLLWTILNSKTHKRTAAQVKWKIRATPLHLMKKMMKKLLKLMVYSVRSMLSPQDFSLGPAQYLLEVLLSDRARNLLLYD